MGAEVLVIGGYGHIGSALCEHLGAKGITFDICDSVVRGRPQNFPESFSSNYLAIEAEQLSQYRTVVFLGGKTSVQACEPAQTDFLRAISDNVILPAQYLFTHFAKRVIYASSASVLAPREQSRAYDLTMALREKAAVFHNDAIGFRFGTVCGRSPNPRNELLINAMVDSALQDGVVHIGNAHASRPVLGMKDCLAALTLAIQGAVSPGVYNVVSFNRSIAQVGRAVAKALRVSAEFADYPPTYDYRVTPSSLPGWRPSATVESIVRELVP